MGKYKESWFAEGKMANWLGNCTNERMARREAWAGALGVNGVWNLEAVFWICWCDSSCVKQAPTVGQIKYRKFSLRRMRGGTRQHRIIIAKKCAKDPIVWRIRTIWKGRSRAQRGGRAAEGKHLPNVVAVFRCLWPNKFAHKATFIKHKQSHCQPWYVRV